MYCGSHRFRRMEVERFPDVVVDGTVRDFFPVRLDCCSGI